MDVKAPGKSSGTASTSADTGVEAPGRTWSLQREWSWAFVLMFLAVLLGAAATSSASGAS